MMLTGALVTVSLVLDRVMTIWLMVAFLLVISTFVFGWPGFLVPPRFRDDGANGSD
jgi:hypothetical protein